MGGKVYSRSFNINELPVSLMFIYPQEKKYPRQNANDIHLNLRLEWCTAWVCSFTKWLLMSHCLSIKRKCSLINEPYVESVASVSYPSSYIFVKLNSLSLCIMYDHSFVDPMTWCGKVTITRKYTPSQFVISETYTQIEVKSSLWD